MNDVSRRASRSSVRLRGLGWDHERCSAPLRACSEAWERLEPGTAVTWEHRSLTAFGDEPLEEVAQLYDLIVIDHPFCGTAAATGVLTPLDTLLSPDQLATFAADSIGPSHDSYSFHGRQWALATDAACQVSAVRDDLLDGSPVPTTWDEVRSLARARPGKVAIPLAPAQAICTFLSLCANMGNPAAGDRSRLVSPAAGLAAVEVLAELFRLGPRNAIGWEQPDVLERLTSDDELVYVPLVFGFVTYARADRVRNPCRFLDIPSAGAGPVGAILGGAGLAVSATSKHQAEAAAFAAFASGTDAQRNLVGPAGGQPGSQTAWLDPELDRVDGGFFSGTIETMKQAWVRPRDRFWPAFQLEGGRLLSGGLALEEPPRSLLQALENLYRDCIRRYT